MNKRQKKKKFKKYIDKRIDKLLAELAPEEMCEPPSEDMWGIKPQKDMLPAHACFNPVKYASNDCPGCGFNERCAWEGKGKYRRLCG